MAGTGQMPIGGLYSAYTQPPPPPAPAPTAAPSSPSLNVGAPVTFSGGSTDYTSAYNAALQTNQQLYNNINNGYNATMAYQQQQSAGISSGYDQLSADVLGQLAGTQTAANQAAADSYAQQTGQMTQDMVNRGLGNTTVTTSAARGLQYDYQKVLGQNAANFGQLNANYMSQIGLQGLGYQGQALNQTVGLADQQLNWMNSVSVPYPDPYSYAAANQAKGAASVKPGSYNMPPMSGGVSMPSTGKPPGTGGGSTAYPPSNSYGGGGSYGAAPISYPSQPSESTLYPSLSSYSMAGAAGGMAQTGGYDPYAGYEQAPYPYPGGAEGVDPGWYDETSSW